MALRELYRVAVTFTAVAAPAYRLAVIAAVRAAPGQRDGVVGMDVVTTAAVHADLGHRIDRPTPASKPISADQLRVPKVPTDAVALPSSLQQLRIGSFALALSGYQCITVCLVVGTLPSQDCLTIPFTVPAPALKPGSTVGRVVLAMVLVQGIAIGSPIPAPHRIDSCAVVLLVLPLICTDAGWTLPAYPLPRLTGMLRLSPVPPRCTPAVGPVRRRRVK